MFHKFNIAIRNLVTLWAVCNLSVYLISSKDTIITLKITLRSNMSLVTTPRIFTVG